MVAVIYFYYNNFCIYFVFKQLSPPFAVSSSDEGHELALELGQPKFFFFLDVSFIIILNDKLR